MLSFKIGCSNFARLFSMNCFVSYKFGFRVARSRRPEKEEPGGEAEGGVEDGREGNKDEPAGGTEMRKVNQGSRGAAGLRAILKEEGGKGGGQDGKGLKVGRGRSSHWANSMGDPRVLSNFLNWLVWCCFQCLKVGGAYI